MRDSSWNLIHRLVTQELTGESSEEDRKKLADMLRDDREACRKYVAYLQDSAELRWLCSKHPEVESEETAPGQPPCSLESPGERLQRGSWGTQSRLAALAASVLFVGLSSWMAVQLLRGGDVPVEVTRSDPETQTRPPTLAVATVSHLRNVKWADGQTPSKELSRLRMGDVVALESGEIELVFDGGVELVARGASRFCIESPLSVYGEYGALSARVGESGRGFTINTPTTKIVDRGTQFGVSINSDGDTDVACFEGRVDLSYRNANDAQATLVQDQLLQGEGVRVESHGSISRLFCVNDSEYPALSLPRRPPLQRSPTITKVRDSLRGPDSKKFYRIVPSGFEEDALAYVDRPHQWNGLDESGIPLFLRGADYVMPFNDDKFSEDFEVELTIDHPSVLYVIISDALDTPKWLSDSFENTTSQVGLDEGYSRFRKSRTVGFGPGASIDTTFTVWRRVIAKPGIVRLGAIQRPAKVAGYNMYAFAAQPWAQ